MSEAHRSFCAWNMPPLTGLILVIVFSYKDAAPTVLFFGQGARTALSAASQSFAGPARDEIFVVRPAINEKAPAGRRIPLKIFWKELKQKIPSI
ncbi:MAG TPA: hypothetical protein VFB72_04025 [Verrucomicrobiae bacterium]|nr:hypothetical protein [Verrucomicrobiae bacterium]